MEQQRTKPQVFTSLKNQLPYEWEITKANPSALELHRLPELQLQGLMEKESNRIEKLLNEYAVLVDLEQGVNFTSHFLALTWNFKQHPALMCLKLFV